MRVAYVDADFVAYNPFEGERDVDIKCRTVKVVTTRKPQQCYQPEGRLHTIPAGTRARCEKALVDGEWGSFYTCVKCMTRWMREVGVRSIRGKDA